MTKESITIYTSEIDDEYIEQARENLLDFVDEEGGRIINDSDVMDECYRMKEDDYEYEKDMLNVKLDNNIVLIGVIGRWDGHRLAYKELSNNLNNILDRSDDGDYYTVVMNKNDVIATESHHDGRNYYLYRELRKDKTLESFMNAMSRAKQNGKKLMPVVSRYTKSLVPYVKERYGLI